MAPSKRWMELVDDRLSETYEMGVQSFLNYAFKRTGKNKEVRCPCVKCSNTYSGTRELVETHMKVYGIVQNYTFWYHHGERSDEPQSESDSDDEEEIEEDESDNEMHEIIRDLYPEFSDDNRNFENFNSMSNDELEEEPNDEAKKFYRLLRDSNQSLYDGSKSSKLSLLVKLLHIKSLGGWSNTSFTMLLQLLKEELLPSGTNFPNSYYEAKKIIQDLGGLKPNDMRTSGSKSELQAKLRESQRENQSLKNRMDEMENEVRMIKEMLQRQQSSTSPPPSNGQLI